MNIIVDELNERKRADVIVADANTEYSRAALKKLFEMGNVLLDGEPARPGSKPRAGQILQIDLAPIQQEPDVIELPVIFEDDDVIVVNKPAGIISHSRGRYWQEASVASFIRDKTRHMKGERAGIVHRLDRATSGVMISAKTEAAQAFLQAQFNKKQVKKQYIALVAGTPEPAEAQIVAPIGRNPAKPQQFIVSQEGKSAETNYTVLKSHKGVCMVRLQPATGRTHQLRVHMSYIGHPIIGDLLYAHQTTPIEERMYLHAQNLHIKLPSGEERTFAAPLPSIFEERLARG